MLQVTLPMGTRNEAIDVMYTSKSGICAKAATGKYICEEFQTLQLNLILLQIPFMFARQKFTSVGEKGRVF